MRPLLSRFAAGATDRLPEQIEHALLRLRSRRTDAPTVGLPRVRRALLLAPHPDDETLACGGTAALLAAAGTDVRVVVLTDGEAAKVALAGAEVRRRRRAEATEACRALGLPPPLRAGLPDGRLHEHVPALAREVAGHLDGQRPELVLLPWFGDGHPDHEAVNDALVLAADGRDDPVQVWGAETWVPAPVTRLVDVTAVEGRLRSAVAAHATAARSFDLEAMLALKRYRSLHGLRGRGLAEGFLAAELRTYTALVRRDRRPR